MMRVQVPVAHVAALSAFFLNLMLTIASGTVICSIYPNHPNSFKTELIECPGQCCPKSYPNSVALACCSTTSSGTITTTTEKSLNELADVASSISSSHQNLALVWIIAPSLVGCSLVCALTLIIVYFVAWSRSMRTIHPPTLVYAQLCSNDVKPTAPVKKTSSASHFVNRKSSSLFVVREHQPADGSSTQQFRRGSLTPIRVDNCDGQTTPTPSLTKSLD